MPTFRSLTAAVVVSVDWNPKPVKPVSWERDWQWRVIVQFPDGSQRRGQWNPEWVVPHDEGHYVLGCRLAEYDVGTQVRFYEAWQEIEDTLIADSIA
ncbi:hypothetical protein [Actinacidiphila sp. ITFR-21]|uniref:hypothetical protein n=1 Tax=Actinacidiphila sp. ITFR-21 TaxID=3075199 RepID=UPI00288A9551|nr:hypothetical protein [Streptomyces sp. ITFR-21]WNI17670.1 hypothetical protein RLT57_20485 [Streptomyces sp. ITFR-21]WNI17810.1 hypothetical protein RLT57_21200 [Streptomyces sp. ITFR-21]